MGVNGTVGVRGNAKIATIIELIPYNTTYISKLDATYSAPEDQITHARTHARTQ